MKKVLLLALTMLLASKTSLAIVNNPDKYGNTSPTKTTAQVQDISLDGKWRFIADSTDYSQGLPANKKACGYVSTDVPSQNRVGGTPYIVRKHRLK